MLLMQNININLTTQDGRKAKDITENKKIITVINNYEKMSQQQLDDSRPLIGIIEEKDEDEDEDQSSFT